VTSNFLAAARTWWHGGADQRAFPEQSEHSASGGGLYASSTLALTGTQFVNQPRDVMVAPCPYRRRCDIVNALFARNTAPVLYLRLSSGSVQSCIQRLPADTLRRHSIYILAARSAIPTPYAAAHLRLFQFPVTVFQDYNSWVGNTFRSMANVSGGGNNASGNPNFVNPRPPTLSPAVPSAAIDAG